MTHPIGTWKCDQYGLPVFSYEGDLPFRATMKNGEAASSPEDPYFLLGNYQLTLFARVSGTYDLITGQRAYGRMNAAWDGTPACRSELAVGKEAPISLIGLSSPAAKSGICSRTFGCGFASYEYALPECTLKRTLAVRPSATYDGGVSAFLLTVKIENTSEKPLEFSYTEALSHAYEELQYQEVPHEARVVQYSYSPFTAPHCVGVHTIGKAEDPLLFESREARSKYEGFPPSLYLKALTDGVTLSNDAGELAAVCRVFLSPGKSAEIKLLIGFGFSDNLSFLGAATDALSHSASPKDNPFGGDWTEILPTLSEETDEALRREMRWNAYVLEAMATYSEYYGETKVPQGGVYEYHWGCHASARDNLQHGLPFVYFHPDLAKSILRYFLKRATPRGEILLMETGNAFTDNSQYLTSDQQLFFFLLLSEYLRVTHDHAFLSEEVPYFPVKGASARTVLTGVKECFLYLRDVVGVGEHGLVRLLNSDWNDAVYYMIAAPYNSVVGGGESHMNSAMAISISGTLLTALSEAKDALPDAGRELSLLAESMGLYRETIRAAYMKDWGERSFPRRMYFACHAFGEENMYLEPMGYTLLIPELSEEKKRVLYREMQKRVYPGEALGARQQEDPEFSDDGQEKGSRENGGFWWALNGPVVMGVSTFDKKEAWRLLQNMTFRHFSECFPEYWSAYWTASDNQESSLMPGEGLPDQSFFYGEYPAYCAHPHAWLLFCYYYLQEQA